ncbi:Protein of unknown function [Cotesia congregata]|uniref:Ig-like domain-containing protein n=1 Tax=Cotesia congregata TaxID=51543 RepID=A0A8J2HCQ5_COTCN|nr:Protein of unknown function [Cotesia congregata]
MILYFYVNVLKLYITGGSINEAVFALRDRQEGGRRGRRTTTSTTSTTTITTAATSISIPDNVAQPAALLAPDDQTWFVASTSTPSNFPLVIKDTSRLPPLEIVIKPQAKVVLPCELGGNYSRLLPFARNYRMRPAKWLHNDVPVDMITIDTRTEMSGTGHRYIGDSSTAALHIDSARLEDDGIWKCTIENDHDELLFGRTVKLVILGKL